MATRDLPPGLRARRQASGNVYFYLKIGTMKKELPLGADPVAALTEWRVHTLKRCLSGGPVTRICALLDTFRLAEIPTRNPRMRLALDRQLAALEKFFAQHGNPELTAELPLLETYFGYRGPRFELRACAEIRLVAHIWGWGHRLSVINGHLKCPWTSNSVQARIRVGVNREIGEALLSIACREEASSLSKQIRGEMQISPTLEQAREKIESIILLPGVRETQSPLTPVQALTDETAAKTFLHEAAKQLKMDGRVDLAREVQRLPASQLQTVLWLALLKAPPKAHEAKLMLGARRSARLLELRATMKATKG